MTVYRVDPWNGSNSNNGLTWGSAWKYLPGDGTPLQPGDEVRFAKCPTRTTDTAIYNNFGGTVTLPVARYSNIAPPSTWTASATGVTTATSSLRFAVSTTFPAATKMGYAVWNASFTQGRAVHVRTKLYGHFPVDGDIGKYLKVCLCSDAAGNTPIADLHGCIYRTASSTYAVWSHFRYESASTLSLTVGSIAIYTIDAMTTGTVQASFMIDTGLFSSPASDENDFIPPDASLISPVGTLYTAPVKPIPDVYSVWRMYGESTASTTVYMRSWGNKSLVMPGSPATTPLSYYIPVPYGFPSQYNVRHTFSGTAGNPIKLRGGFNTSTDEQDGYTALGWGGLEVYYQESRGFFPFSSGGDYLEFENFLAYNFHLYHHTSASGSYTINSLKFTRCALGNHNGYSFPWYISTPSVTALTIVDLHHEQCMLAILPAAGKGGSSTYSTGSVLHTRLSYTDCLLNAGFAYYAPKVSEYYRIDGTSAYLSTFVGASLEIIIDMTLAVAFRISNTEIYDILTVRPNSASLACAGTVLIDGVRLSCASGNTSFLRLQNLKTTEVRGIAVNASTGSTVYLTYVGPTDPVWFGNNPGATITMNGPVNYPTSNALAFYFEFVRIVNVVFGPSYSDIGTKRPGLVLTNIGALPLEDRRLSFVVISYTTDLSSYMQVAYETYGVVLRNCQTRLGVREAPTGFVKAFGCTFNFNTLPADFCDAPASGGFPAYNGFTLSSVIGYGCTFQGKVSTAVPSSGVVGVGFNTVGIWSGTKGSFTIAKDPGYNAYNRTAGAAIHCDPETTWTSEEELASPYIYALPILVRNNKKFEYRVGVGKAVSGLLRNQYGKFDIALRKGMVLAKLDVRSGVPVAMQITVRAAAITTFRMIIPPSAIYSTSILGHAIVRHVKTLNTDLTYSFNISPDKDGSVDVHVFSTNDITIRDFQVTAI